MDNDLKSKLNTIANLPLLPSARLALVTELLGSPDYECGECGQMVKGKPALITAEQAAELLGFSQKSEQK